jgi:hypothetical protein
MVYVKLYKTHTTASVKQDSTELVVKTVSNYLYILRE